MASQPSEYPEGTQALLEDDLGSIWTPLYHADCSFPSDIYSQVMTNLIRNPNINSNHLFRADILLETSYTHGTEYAPLPRLLQIQGFNLESVIIRRMIPRNMLVDKPLDQTCLIYSQKDELGSKSLVIYLPHISSPSECPFYHPAVHGIAFLHTFNVQSQAGNISIHYSFFESAPRTESLQRTAFHLLRTIQKHGNGLNNGYVKKVHHDVILPQVKTQNTYARLKSKYAKVLITSWVEVTDPTKHVFEDLGIAAFLIELWAEMYPEGTEFPGFVDIGCGNGLLTHILLEEGYSGWGFDARKRKSWDTYSAKAQESLKEFVLIPSIIQSHKENHYDTTNSKRTEANIQGTHPGIFPKGTFIISNHADELTPWTPILANISESPFIAIPCCSHNLTGSRFRAPPSKEAGVSSSAYASLVVWVSKLAEDCGWKLEKEMLRIPSTRKACLLGRERTKPFADVDMVDMIAAYGGAAGWEENAMKLVNVGPRGH
jgi:tRNASer (uridine44-2'-O)-methyltransferase